MANQTQLSSSKIGTFRQIVPLIFPSDDKGRARSAKMFSIYYNSFSYGLLKKKGARSAEMFSMYTLFSYGLLKKKGARSLQLF